MFKDVSGQARPKANTKASTEHVVVDPCERCINFDRRGSNKYVEVLTWKVCGSRTKTTKMQPEARDPETCPHARLSFARSSKSMHRTFCEDCQTVVAEEPQSVYKARLEQGLATGKPERVPLVMSPPTTQLPDV